MPNAPQLDPHYALPQLAQLYDLSCGWSPDRNFYLSLPANPPQRILDLGCGTGLICRHYAAQGHQVTGVDPAAAMLAVARREPNGQQVNWVKASAQHFHLNRSK